MGFGGVIVLVGAYLIYAAVTNQAPIKTIQAIIANPINARTILAGRALPISASGTTGVQAGSVTGGGGGSVVTFARSKIGQPYRFGGHTEGGWDCSGLVLEALKVGYGLSIAHSATAQLLDPRGKKVAKADLQPGDIVFPNVPPFAGDHVQIYSGNGNVIEAARPGTNVREVAMWGFFTAKRFS